MGSTKRLLPTGECWCGCGAETAIGSFFLQGHDKTAESAVISVEYGGVPGFLVHHGYGPGGQERTTRSRQVAYQEQTRE